eukprot:gene2924-8171_t
MGRLLLYVYRKFDDDPTSGQALRQLQSDFHEYLVTNAVKEQNQLAHDKAVYADYMFISSSFINAGNGYMQHIILNIQKKRKFLPFISFGTNAIIEVESECND